MIIRFRKIQVFAFLSFALLISLALGLQMQLITVNLTVEHIPENPLPIVMYHQLTKDTNRTGMYTITVEQFERDLKFLQEQGYHTIKVEDLLAYVNNGIPLPEKPIMITFDDAYETVYSYAYPLLQQYNFCIILSVIGSVTENFSQIEDHNLRYSYLTWKEAKEMAASGHAELQSHSYDLHKREGGRVGAKKKRSESREEYQSVLYADLMRMQDAVFENTGYCPSALAYPFGEWSEESADILREVGLKAAFTCEEKINKMETEDVDWLYRLRRFNRASGKSAESFFARLGIG